MTKFPTVDAQRWVEDLKLAVECIAHRSGLEGAEASFQWKEDYVANFRLTTGDGTWASEASVSMCGTYSGRLITDPEGFHVAVADHLIVELVRSRIRSAAEALSCEG